MKAQNLGAVLCALVFFPSFLAQENEGNLVVLSDDNFEHLTQVSTGATTGDWLILMAPKGECKQCNKMEEILKEVSITFKGRKNVAKLDRDNSRLTLRRFKIRSPSLKFFRNGVMWDYTGMVAATNLGQFISEGHQNYRGSYIPKQIDSIDAWQEDFVNELKSAYKQRRLPEIKTLFTAIGIGLVGLLLLFCMLAPKKSSQKEEPKRKKQSKKQR